MRMEVIRRIVDIRSRLAAERARGKTIGLVPTMGYFHEGHLSLMRQARTECDVVVTSLYVNPTQFGPSEDLSSYPRDMERDRRLAQEAGVDFLFCPKDSEIYGDGHMTYVEVEELGGKLCGRSRPSHFRGVTTIVAKLFNIIGPNKAYFGQKDAQQVVVIEKMVEDLNFDIEIRVVPTKRESDGLAMSSRNAYLSQEERAEAPVLYESLKRAQALIRSGQLKADEIEEEIQRTISGKSRIQLEYVSVCDRKTLQETSTINGDVLIALAAKVGKARLIDNLVVKL